MSRALRTGKQPEQLTLLLPDRQALRGLSAAARSELLDVMAQLLLQAQERETSMGELDLRESDDDE